MKLVLIRHGESDWNQKDVFTGLVRHLTLRRKRQCITF